MSKIYNNDELYDLPLDIVKATNREWRLGVDLHDKKWHWVKSKHPNYLIDKYIKKNYPELENQFEWEFLTGNERMAKKFGHIKTQTQTYYANYSSHYNGNQYDADLDPFND